MSLKDNLQNTAVITDLENQDLSTCLKEPFKRAGILPLINQAREIYVHTPLGATIFHDKKPIGGTFLDVELAKAIILACPNKQVIFYEAPATAHKNIKILFDKLGYTDLADKYSQVRLLDLKEEDASTKQDCVTLHYGFKYPPLILPGFLFDKDNLIISFSNPKAPFSEKVAGFKGLPVSLSGKSLIIGSSIFSKKNLLHLAFSDIGLGLKDFIAGGLSKIYEAGVNCVGINGGRVAGAMVDQIKVHPIEWNALVISSNISVADVVTVALMGFNPPEIGYFQELTQQGFIPMNLSEVSVTEIGNARARLERQLANENPFLPQGTPITTRQWIFGMLGQLSFKDRLGMMGRIIPSIIKYKIGKKRKSGSSAAESV